MWAMKKYAIAIFLMLVGSLSRGGLVPSTVLAVSAPTAATPPGLSLAEIKITGNEFIFLQNNSGASIPDLSKYWLYVFNNVNPLASGVSSSSQQLPAGSLAAGQTVLLSASGGNTCGAAITAKLNLSLNDSGGFLEVIQTDFIGGQLTQTAGDSVSWSSGTNSAAGMISNVPNNTSAPNGAYYRYQNSGSGTAYLWQFANLDAANSCQLNVTISGATVSGPSGIGSQLLPGSAPPVTIVSLSDDSSTTTGDSLPAADIGLETPQINEVMPNPAEPQTDNEDEFIEIYNSNDVAFDLTGFKLQTGTTSLHNYSFPAGRNLPAKSFTAFYSIDTNLSLSNSSGQVRLLDPAGNVIGQTDAYSNAPDGQSWALANGTWYWTLTPTAGSANVINQPLSVKKLSTSPSPSSGATAKKTSSAKSSSGSTPKVKAASTTTANNAKPSTPSKNSSPLHPLVLAGIGAGALGYGAYEYRNDLANRYYQLRRYRASRAVAGSATKKP